jgi:hypothetical protein
MNASSGVLIQKKIDPTANFFYLTYARHLWMPPTPMSIGSGL